MYSKRVRVVIILSVLMSLVPLARLAQMLVFPDPTVDRRIEDLKAGSPHQMQTLRGQILDRRGRILAKEEAVFRIYLSYELTQHVDSRVARADEFKAMGIKDPGKRRAAVEAVETLRRQREADLQLLLDKCEQFGFSPTKIKAVIKNKNDAIWDLRMLQVWKAECRDSDLYQRYLGSMASVKPSEARPVLQATIPDEKWRLRLINDVKIAEMQDPWPVLELRTEHDVMAAQLEFLDIEYCAIAPEPVRRYPYGSVAAQTIGWVGPVTEPSKDLFKKDKLREYLNHELCGRFDGVEFMAEALLRGRRGEERRDIDGNLIAEIDPQLGQDIRLTLDIELQRDIENRILHEYLHRPCCRDTGKAAVVIDINSGDILALVSLPTFDLTTVRSEYNRLADPNNENTPLVNRALYKHYPPGSVAKPLVCVAGLEAEAITPEESIGCPLKAAPIRPNCWIYNDSNGQKCHDQYWTDNKARNAIRGSCNIYFAQLAERIETRVLQKWFFDFGYGRQVPLAATTPLAAPTRTLRQASGLISSRRPRHARVTSFDQIPPLNRGHRRLAGIGQGEIFVTPLQVANSLATLARNGIALTPRLFIPPEDARLQQERIDLQISATTLRTVLEGLEAVVHERHGTAYDAFQEVGGLEIADHKVRVYGKTGSTQGPENAWFAGFAKDYSDRGVALAIVVEGGESGSKDAAPLGREIISLCIERGYVGSSSR